MHGYLWWNRLGTKSLRSVSDESSGTIHFSLFMRYPSGACLGCELNGLLIFRVQPLIRGTISGFITGIRRYENSGPVTIMSDSARNSDSASKYQTATHRVNLILSNYCAMVPCRQRYHARLLKHQPESAIRTKRDFYFGHFTRPL